MFDEFLSLTPRAIDVSATPGEIELASVGGRGS
jgi:excinuclease UvrABC helicase subunit UvrB